MSNKNNSESEDSCQSEKRDWVLLQIKTNSIPALPCWLHLYLLWGKSTDILGEYLGNGAKTPWVMENFLIVTQHVLKLCTSRSVHPENFWMFWKSSQLEMQSKVPAHLTSLTGCATSFSCILWTKSMTFALFLTLHLRQAILSLIPALFWDKSFS